MNAALLLLIIKENRRLLITVALLAVFSLLFGYVFAHRRVRLERLQSAWSDKRRQVAARSQVDAVSGYRQGGEAIRRLMARIPARVEFPRVLGQLMDISSASGVVLTGMSYKPQKAALDGIITYSLSCTANGSYPALKRFLNDMQGMDGLTTVETVTLSNNDPFEVKAAMEISLSVYLREAGQ